jgi:hypothetical protein
MWRTQRNNEDLLTVVAIASPEVYVAHSAQQRRFINSCCDRFVRSICGALSATTKIYYKCFTENDITAVLIWVDHSRGEWLFTPLKAAENEVRFDITTVGVWSPNPYKYQET